MAENDTHVFDLLELAPVVNGWSLLGEVERYVRVSRDRIHDVSFAPAGIRVNLMGSEGETIELTALRPVRLSAHARKGQEVVAPIQDWDIIVKRAIFPKGSGGRMELMFE